MRRPNFTAIPNEVFDEHMRSLSGSELKVLLVVCRKTIGFHKDTDSISISQIEEMAGISNRSAIDAVNALVEKNILMKDSKKGATSKYTLDIDGYEESSQAASEESSLELVKKVHTTSEESSQTKETLQKKETNDPRLVTNIFWERYESVVGEKPRWKEQYRKMALGLLRSSSLETIRSAIEEYFEDPWWKERGWDFGMFCSQFDKFRARVKTRPPVEKVLRMVPDGNGGVRGVEAPRLFEEQG